MMMINATGRKAWCNHAHPTAHGGHDTTPPISSHRFYDAKTPPTNDSLPCHHSLNELNMPERSVNPVPELSSIRSMSENSSCCCCCVVPACPACPACPALPPPWLCVWATVPVVARACTVAPAWCAVVSVVGVHWGHTAVWPVAL